MVEFALVAPVLFLVLIAIFQFGQAFTDYIQVTNAARDGARKAIVSRSDANGVTTVQNTVKASVWSLNKSNMGISVYTRSAVDGRPGGDRDSHVSVQHQHHGCGGGVGNADLHDHPAHRVAVPPTSVAQLDFA